MELYCAQHGKAHAKAEEPDRPLTDAGRTETVRVARAAARAGVRVHVVWHSGKLRALQTAEAFADALEPQGGVVERDFLGPNDDPSRAVEAARNAGGAVLLVGHLPYMDRLPSLLLTGDPERGVLDIRYSALMAFEAEEERWRLRWYLRPELVG